MSDDNDDSDQAFKELAPATDRAQMRYDHTDMTDFNGLTMEYRRMSLATAC